MDDHEHIGYQLKALDHMFRRHIDMEIRKNGFDGMTVMNSWIIEYLGKNEGKSIYQKDLEQKFQVGKSSMAGTLKIMEEKGFIVRKSVPGDARLKQVFLTDEARTYIHKMEQGRRNMEAKVSRGLTDEEIALFKKVIKKMRDNLSE